MRNVVVILFIVVCFFQQLSAQDEMSMEDYSAKLEDGVLMLENSKISRTYNWNNGNISTISLCDKISGKVWIMEGDKPDLALSGETEKAANAVFSTSIVEETPIAPKYLEAKITYSLGSLEIKRVFRLYANCPAIACDLYFKGESTSIWLQSGVNMGDMVNIEKLSSRNVATTVPVLEKLELPGRHWKLNVVEFFDITDRFNNLALSVNVLSYRPNMYKGNLLFAYDNATDNGVFILKEAPTSNVQLAYPGSDFMTDYGTFRLVGAGITPEDLDNNEWKRAYGFVTGVYSEGERNGLLALRNYQKNIRKHMPDRDEMVLMNTWGDRGQDSRINEEFALAELEAGAKLGISHFQLDDGWQLGQSSNSAFKGGSLESIWDNPNYWAPHPERFPNGLDPVIKKGKELGIEVCLWFNPSRDNSNEYWEKDADMLIKLYRQYGIRTFKIDGVKLPDKTAEINFRKFLDKVNLETNNNVVFNLDVTAGRRGGYNYFNKYGNLFLENRYTDWTNYFPYTTLRNLWMLSKYVPAENLQVEFLNKWRNTDNYKGDPFAPENYSFDYLFAITMAAQPLAWFEGTGLPKEAIAVVAPVIRKYREVQHDFHSGAIFPIGDEPSGRSWTGFQSIQEGKGYFIIFREANDLSKFQIKTWLTKGETIECIPIIGKGKAFTAKVGQDGIVNFKLPEKNSYALYKYVNK
ncbi:MAG: alpha-galactosidase [Salinivirgaceae bacterium]|nr:alpha-galactosidase [Salinivirgaceae bacterium]